MKQTTTRSWTSFRLSGPAPEAALAKDETVAEGIPAHAVGASVGTFIDSGAVFEGNLKLAGDFRIDNEFRGQLTTDGTVIVGPSGSVEGSISARQVEIEGAVVGDISVRRLCILRASGRLHGDVETPCFEIERHAFFQGQTRMTHPLTDVPHADTTTAPLPPT